MRGFYFIICFLLKRKLFIMLLNTFTLQVSAAISKQSFYNTTAALADLKLTGAKCFEYLKKNRLMVSKRMIKENTQFIFAEKTA